MYLLLVNKNQIIEKKKINEWKRLHFICDLCRFEMKNKNKNDFLQGGYGADF